MYVNKNIKLVSTWPCGAFWVSLIKEKKKKKKQCIVIRFL